MSSSFLRALLALVVVAANDEQLGLYGAPAGQATDSTARSACAGGRAPLPDALFYKLQTAPFPDSDHPDAAVHVPRGFDATWRPGLVVYFHGWQGCIAAALGGEDTPCTEGGPSRRAADLAGQMDAARVNALLLALETRVDMPTGEPGSLAMPGGLRAILHELFSSHLAEPLGCALEVDALDRVVIVAHSGGYQAAAGALAVGDVPRVTEVDLLDALYGATSIFSRWIRTQTARFDPRVQDVIRFVDLYTCCGGTAEASRAMASDARSVLQEAGLAHAFYEEDGAGEVDPAMLAHTVVFKRVPRAHEELPRAYLRELVQAAGFAPLASYSQRPK